MQYCTCRERLRDDMLDKILGTNSENVSQSQNLDRINQIGATNPFEGTKADYFVDESNISSEAIAKYEHELDVKKFSEILMQYDEKDALEEVLQKVFDGSISIDNDEFLTDLLTNEDFLNDIA